MKKLIETAMALGQWKEFLRTDYNIKVLDDDGISAMLEDIMLLWGELEKEEKKYMRKPGIAVSSPNYPVEAYNERNWK